MQVISFHYSVHKENPAGVRFYISPTSFAVKKKEREVTLSSPAFICQIVLPFQYLFAPFSIDHAEKMYHKSIMNY